MDNIQTIFYGDPTSEFLALQGHSSPIDLTDSPLSSDLVSSLTPQSSYLVTQPRYVGFSEVEFNLANNFWGCDFALGSNSAPNCGQQIRQGIAHLVDKTKFVASEPWLKGYGSPIDNPFPAGGGIATPNACNWDSLFSESGPGCVVGTGDPSQNSQYTGGTSYHISSATGSVHGLQAWQPYYGDADFCAGADHFITAGLATGKNPITSSNNPCTLKGTSPSVSSHPVTFFVRNDDLALFDLGNSLVQEICALFGNGFVTGCGPLTVVYGSISAFPGYAFNGITPINLSWGMYTAGGEDSYGSDIPLYDAKDRLEASIGLLRIGGNQPPGREDAIQTLGAFLLEFASNFVSVVSSIQPPCSPSATISRSPSNYVYMCNPVFDKLASLMTSAAPCLSSPGNPDPTPGQTIPTYANCSGQSVTGTCNSSSACTAATAGYQTMDLFGRAEYAIPVYTPTAQYGYLNNGWNRAVNSVTGLPNHFTWLDIWNPSRWNLNDPNYGTIRQGVSQQTRTLNPYLASDASEIAMIDSVYDPLMVGNPYFSSQLVGWAASFYSPLTSLTYPPPPGTVNTYRFSLMPNLIWQDGGPVTAFDVAFSYLTLKETGSFLGSGLGSMTGITILSPTQFDINVNATGPFALPALVSVPILPGRYWTSVGPSSWDYDINTCTSASNTCYPVQFYLSSPSGPVACGSGNGLSNCQPFITPPNPIKPLGSSAMEPDNQKVVLDCDPINPNGQNNCASLLIGFGPWECKSSSGSVGGGCSSTGTANPPSGGSYTLQRNGKGIAPGFPGDYFRSGGFLATYLWSGDMSGGVNNFSAAKACFGVTPLDPLSSGPPVSACGHWQQGIGTNGATTPAGTGGCPGAPNTSPCGIPVGSSQLSIVKLYLNINWVYPSIWNSLEAPAGIVPLNPILYEGGAILNPATVTGCIPPYPTGGYDC